MQDRPDAFAMVRLPAERTLAGYDRWAASYDATDNPLVAATAWLLAQHPLDVAGCQVVEPGCGTGRHAAPVLAAGAAGYTGIDGSAGMLAVAQALPHDDRVRFVCADVAATGLPAGAFERALVVLVLEHLADPAPLCRELARLLAVGGTVRLVEIHPDLLTAGANAHFHVGAVEHRFTSFCHSVPTLLAALHAAGLAVTMHREHRADGDLLAAVPKLARHRGRAVALDLVAEHR